MPLTISRNSASVAAKRTRGIGQTDTSENWPPRATRSVSRIGKRESVSEQRPKRRKWPVTDHARLARELGVSPTILRIFINKGYIRESAKHPIVTRPPEEVADWLRLITGPWSLRPILPLPEVAKLLDYNLSELRKLCAKNSIRVYPDRLFGDMVSAREFFSIRRALETRGSLDRQGMLNILMAMNRTGRPARAPDRPFIAHFEDEIKHIASMQEPQRTIAAAKIWAIYNDAAVMANAVVKARGLKDNEKARTSIMVMMYKLRRAIETGKKWESVASKLHRHNKTMITKLAHEAFAAELARKRGKQPVNSDAQDVDSSACESLTLSDMSSGSSCGP
jgi:hypothetical protein